MGYTILLAEDERDLREVVADYFAEKSSGVLTVETAADGDAALAMIGARAYDLLLLDIKAFDSELCRKLTGADNSNALATLDDCEANGKPVWIRHVLVPGYTLDPEQLEALAAYLAPFRCVERVELLPFHRLAEFKWRALGVKDPLAGVPEPVESEIKTAAEIFSAAGLTVVI